MLHIIGIGTKKEHITQEMIQVIQNSDNVYIEHYTNFYQDSFKDLEEYLNVKIKPCVREDVESRAEEILLNPSKENNISLLIIGDVLVATTHTDLLLRAKKMNIDSKVYHNISIANLITKTGLQWYKFGKCTSIPFFNEKFMPRTPYLQLYDNLTIGAHSLFLLDLNPSNDVAYKGHDKYLPAHRALQFLLDIPKIMLEEEEIEEKEASCIDNETHAIVCSRLGMNDETIWYGTIEQLIEKDSQENLPEPLCVIIPSEMHEIEEEYLRNFKI